VETSFLPETDYNLVNTHREKRKMGQLKFQYAALLGKLSDWLLQSAKQDVLTAYELVEQGKAYLRAAEDLSLEEMHTLENYLLRDIRTFAQALGQDADNSLWWMNTKHNLWQLIAKMADPGKLEWFEMQEDVVHHGIYQAGELVAIGDLVCTHCGHHHQVTGVERILPCIECSYEQFSRMSPEAK
jgi:NADH pyrophosphatase NudC (nudix superfamily)